jgi:hypothetical protein
MTIPTKQEIVALARLHASPIDFEQLEKEGFIEKKGAWYKVLKAIPEHVSRQVRLIKNDKEGNCFVQFSKSWKRAQQLYRRMTGKGYNEYNCTMGQRLFFV